MKWDSIRLANSSLPAKLLITLFLFIVGPGYLVATANIYLKHQDADLEPGLTLDDLKRTFHGLEKEVTPESEVTVNSTMLEQVRPDGEMREYLDEGGEGAVRALMHWLENGASEEDFEKADLVQEGDPSPKEVIESQCVDCHCSGGDMEDLLFADEEEFEVQFALVAEVAEPDDVTVDSGPQILKLEPTPIKRLVHVTHAHIMTIPVFTFIVGALFMMTGFGPKVKLILVPLPLIATFLDIGSWWAARFVEPFIYVIGASGAIFGTAFALQILGILGSMWFGQADE